MRVLPEFLAAVDRYRAELAGELSRPEAIRRLARDALITAGYMRAPEESEGNGEGLRPDEMNAES